MPKLLITCHHLLRHIHLYVDALSTAGIEVTTPRPVNQQFNEDEMADLLPGHNIVIAGDDEITAKVVSKSIPDLKAIIKWGIGTDSIDKDAALQHKIPVFNTPNVFGEEVADLATSMLLNLARGTHIIDRAVRNGEWIKYEGISLSGKTIGIIGLGSIGLAIAKRCNAFNMNVVGYDPFPSAAIDEISYIEKIGFEDLCRTSDFVVLACNLTNDNHHLINSSALALMKHGVYLVNVSRGPLICEDDLVIALKKEIVAGVGLDVFEVEPLRQDSPLRSFDRCIFGSHNGSNTADAVQRVNAMTIQMCDMWFLDTLESKFPKRRVI